MQANRKIPIPRWVTLACLGLLFAGIALTEFIGFLREDYTSSANFISELGAVGAKYAGIINFVAFPMVAITVLAIITFLWRQIPGATLARIGLICIAIGVPIGYMTAALFPCDYGCPMEGSARQAIHNNAGLIEYIIGSLGFVILATGLKDRANGRTRLATFAVGAIMIISFVMMLVPDQNAVRGLWQRAADYGAFLLLIALVFRLRAKA